MILPINQLDWKKNAGLIPAIIQHVTSGEVLMLGYMNNIAFETTQKIGYITFFSRTKQCIWIKGEKSGNTLKVMHFYLDCDNDTLLFLVQPHNYTCHLGNSSCFYPAKSCLAFLYQLENIIKIRKKSIHSKKFSYTTHLYNKGTKYIAQKVGEEGIETALAAIIENKEELINESADLIYHLLVLLQDQKINLYDVINMLKIRHKKINHD